MNTMTNEWDAVGLIFVLLCLVAIAVGCVIAAVRYEQRPRNRYRNGVLPPPQSAAVGTRHFADT